MCVEQWAPELATYCPGTPIVLVGLKQDLRENEAYVQKLRAKGSDVVTKEQGVALAKQIKAVTYIECSARTQEGMKEVFDTAIKVVLFPRRSKTAQPSAQCKCTIM